MWRRPQNLTNAVSAIAVYKFVLPENIHNTKLDTLGLTMRTAARRASETKLSFPKPAAPEVRVESCGTPLIVLF
jgi:hypothetical protein